MFIAFNECHYNYPYPVSADASKLSYRGLLEDFVLLQKERQELLERVFSMESKLCDQQKIVSEQVKI